MHIEYLHDSKYGNGAQVAEEFRAHMTQRGVDVTVHHIRDVDPGKLAQADLYVFSSLAVWASRGATCVASSRSSACPPAPATPSSPPRSTSARQEDRPAADRGEEIARWQHVRPIMTSS